MKENICFRWHGDNCIAVDLKYTGHDGAVKLCSKMPAQNKVIN